MHDYCNSTQKDSLPPVKIKKGKRLVLTMLAIGLLMKKNLLYHFKDVSGNSDKIEKITMRRRQQENMIEKQQEKK